MFQAKEELSQIRRHNKGFTLIEVVAILAIIGSLIMAILPSIELAVNKSSDTQLKTNLTMISGAGKIYKLDTGNYPDSIEILVEEGYLPDKNYAGIEYDKKNGIAKGRASNGKNIATGTGSSL